MFFFFQLAQILPDERVFCRAAPSGTPVSMAFSMSNNFSIRTSIWCKNGKNTAVGGFSKIYDLSNRELKTY